LRWPPVAVSGMASTWAATSNSQDLWMKIF
jgi:hypothetical protein